MYAPPNNSCISARTNRVITTVHMTLMIPRTNPAIDIPDESSLFIPIAPQTIATIGKTNPKNERNHPQHNPIIPKIKLIIPKVFAIFFHLIS